MPRMRTVVVSDLHLGALGGADVAREGEERDALIAAISGADRLVLLGDVVELRERPLAASLEVARPQDPGARGERRRLGGWIGSTRARTTALRRDRPGTPPATGCSPAIRVRLGWGPRPEARGPRR